MHHLTAMTAIPNLQLHIGGGGCPLLLVLSEGPQRVSVGSVH